MTNASFPRADGGLNAYLELIDLLLVGPRSWRVDVLAELRDGLERAAEGHRAAGLSDEQAPQAAIEDFGSPVVVAASFVGEGAATQARGVARRLLFSGPVVAGVWLAAFLVTQPAALFGLVGPMRVLPGIGVVLAVAVPAALLAATAAGRNVLRFGSRPRLATTAAAMAAGACALGDAVMLASFGAWLATTPRLDALAYLLSGLAVTVSAIRLCAATLAVRHCVQTRVRLA